MIYRNQMNAMPVSTPQCGNGGGGDRVYYVIYYRGKD